MDLIKDFGYLIPAAIGGFVDYLNQVNKGAKRWSFLGFLVHMLSALFFGWLAGSVMVAAGYSDDFIAAAGGMGGFLGVRLADLIIYKILKFDRRERKRDQ